jgi:LPPG:FO 2-phospho-L-lactate transferase
MIDTREHGALTFQNWFVRHRTEPAALRVWFDGAAGATPEVLDAVRRAELVIIGPSNPYVSIDPILTLPGVHEALFSRLPRLPRSGGPPRVVAVSPIVHGQAIKGPLATMIPGLAGAAPSAAAIAAHYDRYGGLAGLVVEQGDAFEGLPTLEARTVMRSPADSEALAQAVLEFAARLV